MGRDGRGWGRYRATLWRGILNVDEKWGNNVGRDLRKVHDEATCLEKSQGRTRSTAVRRSTRKSRDKALNYWAGYL